MKTLPYIAMALLLVGCSYVHPIGQVGALRFTKVQVGSLTAPAQTLIVVENTNNGHVEVTQPIGGNGILSAAVLAAGGIGSSLAIADGIDSDQNIRITGITDDAPAPPIVTPPVTPPPVVPPPHHHPPGWNKPKHKWD
jgi:hypothetical protein